MPSVSLLCTKANSTICTQTVSKVCTKTEAGLIGPFELAWPHVTLTGPYCWNNEGSGAWIPTASDYDSNSPSGFATDGTTLTSWRSGNGQYSGMYFKIDLRGSKTFNKIELHHYYPPGYPRNYDMQTSDDNITYTSITTGTGSETKTTIGPFTEQTKRYIKIELTSTNSNWWEMSEVDIFNGGTELTNPPAAAFSFPAGTYLAEYVNGAMRYASGYSNRYSVHDPFTDDNGFWIRYNGGGASVQAPAEMNGSKGQQYDRSSGETDAALLERVEDGSAGETESFTHTGGSICLELVDTPTGDNSMLIRTPQWRLMQTA